MPADIPPAPISAKLDQQERAPCPDLPRVTDGSAIGITSADTDAALDYRKCQAKHGAVVDAFDALALAYQQLRDAITQGVKKGKPHGK